MSIHISLKLASGVIEVIVILYIYSDKMKKSNKF